MSLRLFLTLLLILFNLICSLGQIEYLENPPDLKFDENNVAKLEVGKTKKLTWSLLPDLYLITRAYRDGSVGGNYTTPGPTIRLKRG